MLKFITTNFSSFILIKTHFKARKNGKTVDVYYNKLLLMCCKKIQICVLKEETKFSVTE